MAEILFYHLQRQPLDDVLPGLLTRSLARGWRSLVRATTPERVASLDDHLWTFSDESFLPHGTAREPDAADHPVILTSTDGNPNGADVVFLVDAAPLPADLSNLRRVVILFDGTDEEALQAARRQWSEVKARGGEATYWQQDAGGRWEKRA